MTDETALRAFARDRLASFKVPARVLAVPAIPRTAGGKVRRAEVRALFGGAGAIGPALQSVGINGGYHLFNTLPYALTLLILVLTCRPGSAAAGSPGELSSTN